MDLKTSRKRFNPQTHRQGFKSCLLMVGFLFSSCAKPGDIRIKMPEIKSHPTVKETRSACEIDLDRLKDDLFLCRDQLFDYKYSNQCSDDFYE